ncbi:hypothetical protein Hdeb2414_s0002g00072761 [Helianthus debilis subsp. tardiflorus]
MLNSGKVVAVGPRTHDLSGNKIPVGVKEGDLGLEKCRTHEF